MQTVKTVAKPYAVLKCAVVLTTLAVASMPSVALSQAQTPKVEFTDEDARFQITPVPDGNLLLHIRNGHERIIAFPEPIEAIPEQQSLPGCNIIMDGEIVAFYPTRTFQRVTLKFVGARSGTVYEIGVRSSPDGIIQPLKLVN